MNRWMLLITLHWASNRKRYLLAVPAMLGLLVVWFTFILLMNRYEPMPPVIQYITYYSGLFFVGCLYASTIFSDLSGKTQGIAYLSIPASTLEKLLCGLLFSVAGFFIIYTLVFYIVDIPVISIANSMISHGNRTWPGGYPIDHQLVFRVFRGIGDDPIDQHYHVFLLGYFAAQSAFVLGSVYFTRYAFIKTSVAVMLLMLFFVMLQIRVLEPSLPSGWHQNSLMDWQQDLGNGQITVVRLSPVLSSVFGLFLLYGIPLALWTATYFRLKEKQV